MLDARRTTATTARRSDVHREHSCVGCLIAFVGASVVGEGGTLPASEPSPQAPTTHANMTANKAATDARPTRREHMPTPCRR